MFERRFLLVESLCNTHSNDYLVVAIPKADSRHLREVSRQAGRTRDAVGRTIERFAQQVRRW